MNWLDCLFDVAEQWQTLIAAGLALVAAWWAARPVWRQLDRMEIQSNIMLRDIIVLRIAEVVKRRDAATSLSRETIGRIERDLYWHDEFDPSEVKEDWAFNQENGVRTALGKFTGFRGENPDIEEMEALKDELERSMRAVVEILDDIHRPASTQQHDEDHNISDADWAIIEARGVAAKSELPTAVARWSAAAAAVAAAYTTEERALRGRLVKIDRLLIG